ncbi:ISAs1 family transposase [Streptomyces sp. NPDC102365]|uniref:ISAs1 family transposase n=1 Tax=Streptomyces sp. NPDC102365 TaxID=3366162 RepID=UPI003808129C
MPSALEQLARAEAAAPVADAVRLHHYLALVPDLRGRWGRLYPLVPLLSAAAASVLAGARSLTAISEWPADAPRWALRALGFVPDPLTGRIPVSHLGTVRRLLARLDGDALDAAIGSFLTARTGPAGTGNVLRPIAVDGKTVSGSRTATSPAIALLAAMTHTGDVLAQRQVADKSNEIPAFAPLLDTLDLTGTVITADALHTQHAHGTYLRERGTHYIAHVKANHPGLFDRVRRLPWREITLDHYERTRAHHRQEIRRLKTAAFAHIDYPRREAGSPSRALETGLHQREAHHRTRLPDHQPAARDGNRRPTRCLDPRTLDDREPAAPRPRPHLSRGRVQSPHRRPAPHHGQPAQPRHQRPPPGRPHQHRRSPPPDRPRPTPTPDRPRG